MQWYPELYCTEARETFADRIVCPQCGGPDLAASCKGPVLRPTPHCLGWHTTDVDWIIVPAG